MKWTKLLIKNNDFKNCPDPGCAIFCNDCQVKNRLDVGWYFSDEKNPISGLFAAMFANAYMPPPAAHLYLCD